MALFRSHNPTVREPGIPNLHNGRNCSLPNDQFLVDTRGCTNIAFLHMSLQTPTGAARALLHRAVPHLEVQHIEPLPSYGTLQLFIIHIPDEIQYLLALSPAPDTQPLRCELKPLATAAILLAWLASLSSNKSEAWRQQSGTQKLVQSIQRQSPPPFCYPSRLVRCAQNASPIVQNYLNGFIPNIVCYEPANPVQGFTGLLLVTLPTSTNLIDAPVRLPTIKNQGPIDWQTGQLFRRISCHMSPTGMFGYAADILRPHRQNPFSNMTGGCALWSQAFHLLLESVLRDVEDSLLQIAYEKIREHFQSLRHVLDAVKRPCLVLINGADINNVLMSSAEAEGEFPNLKGVQHINADSVRKDGSQDTFGHENSDGLQVYGLRDWSYCIFGDPLLATVFTDNPSQTFLDGLNTPLPSQDPFQETPVIEDQDHTHIRVALYECYHALCGIARVYRQPQVLGVDMELHWRRRLQIALGTLSNLQI